MYCNDVFFFFCNIYVYINCVLCIFVYVINFSEKKFASMIITMLIAFDIKFNVVGTLRCIHVQFGKLLVFSEQSTINRENDNIDLL